VSLAPRQRGQIKSHRNVSNPSRRGQTGLDDRALRRVPLSRQNPRSHPLDVAVGSRQQMLGYAIGHAVALLCNRPRPGADPLAHRCRQRGRRATVAVGVVGCGALGHLAHRPFNTTAEMGVQAEPQHHADDQQARLNRDAEFGSRRRRIVSLRFDQDFRGGSPKWSGQKATFVLVMMRRDPFGHTLFPRHRHPKPAHIADAPDAAVGLRGFADGVAREPDRLIEASRVGEQRPQGVRRRGKAPLPGAPDCPSPQPQRRAPSLRHLHRRPRRAIKPPCRQSATR
jgi:hypothetical protein